MPTTWNPADKGTFVVLENGNLTAVLPVTGDKSVRSTTSKTTGKWYFECVSNWRVLDNRMPGIMTASADINSFPGADNQGYGIYYDIGPEDWFLWFNFSSNNIGGFAQNGDWVGVCLDLNSNFLYYTINGANLFGNPSAGTGGQAIAAGTWYAAVGGDGNFESPRVTANFGASGFGDRMPAGFSAWDTSTFNFNLFSVPTTSFNQVKQMVGT